jgi:hypothetical protein
MFLDSELEFVQCLTIGECRAIGGDILTTPQQRMDWDSFIDQMFALAPAVPDQATFIIVVGTIAPDGREQMFNLSAEELLGPTDRLLTSLNACVGNESIVDEDHDLLLMNGHTVSGHGRWDELPGLHQALITQGLKGNWLLVTLKWKPQCCL